MKYEFKASFDRRFKKLSSPRQQKVYLAIDALMKCLDDESAPPPGLGLKNWYGNYWEIRAGLKDRILFEFTNRIVFLFVGSHDDILKFMKGRYREADLSAPRNYPGPRCSEKSHNVQSPGQ